jgi:(p)ppGpp synthase/HD superfamily hydrolase
MSEFVGFEPGLEFVAYCIADEAHTGQTDLVGERYILHPARVALNLKRKGFSSEVVAAAMLHDVLEDTYVTAGALQMRSIPLNVIGLVQILTHYPSESYMEYLAKVAMVPDATIIKVADMIDNRSRLDTIRDETVRARLFSKYEAGIFFLADKLLDELGYDSLGH